MIVSITHYSLCVGVYPQLDLLAPEKEVVVLLMLLDFNEERSEFIISHFHLAYREVPFPAASSDGLVS